jgi:rod shape-determining protein MreB
MLNFLITNQPITKSRYPLGMPGGGWPVALTTDIGIDLGTASILVFVKGRGIELNEPAVVAFEQQSQRILAIGSEAQRMLGRTPGNIVAVRPLREGVIADFDITEIMLKHFIAKAGHKRRLFRPRVVVCIPAGTTSVEQKAVIEAVGRTGAREIYLIEEPRAAALGAGLNIFEPSGNMVVDIGGGTSDIAVISMGEVVESTSVRVGGDKFDEAIVRYIKRVYNVLIGERTAESLKIAIGSAHPDSRYLEADVRGRDLVSGLPRSLTITTQQVVEALAEPLWAILQGVKQVLEKTPPELAGDIVERGIVLTGGGALLDGFPRLLTQETGVPFYLAEDSISCVVKGTAKVLDNLSLLSDSLISSRKIAAAY